MAFLKASCNPSDAPGIVSGDDSFCGVVILLPFSFVSEADARDNERSPGPLLITEEGVPL